MTMPRGTELYDRGIAKGRELERASSTVDFETWLAENEDQVIIRSKFLARETQVTLLRMAFEGGRASVQPQGRPLIEALADDE